MKLFETHFEEYVKEVSKTNLHKQNEKIYSCLSSNIKEFPNLILYGKQGIGKYSQALYIINKYSPSQLKYEKKLCIDYLEKSQYFLKMSDIHYEVDFSILGCNAKTLWNCIYTQILNCLSSSTNKQCIILCKNFHNIHSELLDIFYNYMNNDTNIKYILLTESISFIPENIINFSKIITYQCPSKNKLKECFNLQKAIKTNNHINLKYLKSNVNEKQSYETLCDSIIHKIINYKNSDFLEFREMIYNIFIYQYDIHVCIEYITTTLIKQNYLNANNSNDYFIKLYNFYVLFNNNYRPIYHLENLFLYLCRTIHGF